MQVLVLVLFIAALTCFPNAHGQECGCCPNGWTRYEESCYYFTHGHAMTFVEAEHFCLQHNAHLVHVNDALENAFLKDHLMRLKSANFWMGLTDELIEGQMTWIDTDTVPEFTDWIPGQPDDSKSAEDCVHFLNSANYEWNDISCSNPNEAVCERKLGEVTAGVVG